MKSVTEYLQTSSSNFPDKVAFCDGNQQLTYKELDTRARKIATKIINKGLFKQPILLMLDRGVEILAAMLGVAYSGNFYTPVDASMPVSRIRKVVEVLQPKFIISDREFDDLLGEIKADCDTEYLDECYQYPQDNKKVEQAQEKMIDTDLLYVLFTSGSTGVPKGVTITHRSVIDYTEWLTETFHFSDDEIFGNQAPFYFDNSILDIYSTLKNGATMHIISNHLFSVPIRLLEYIQTHKINCIFWVPSALLMVANLRALDDVDVSCLRKILFCGEVMPNKQLNIWRQRLPHALYANLYGPTEITDACTYYIVDREFADIDPLPIGFACNNTDVLVLNDKDEPVAIGETGELCVRGVSLSYGYYRNPQKTTEVFVQNPLNTAYPEIIYRTGDLVKYNDQGELIYICRKDFQIKHMGHRIELGEIETAAIALEQIATAACLYDEEKQRIVLFYVGTSDKREVAENLKCEVPEYMLPRRIIQLDSMPLNPNGKINRVKLKELL